jgi:PAS domain S-box-containing protein
MNLRAKTLLVVSLTILCLTLVLLLISNFLFINNLSDIEENIAYNDAGILNEQLIKELSELNSTTAKLAKQNPNLEFNDTSMAQLISNTNIQMVMVLDPNNNVEYANYYTQTNGSFTNITEPVKTYLSNQDELTNSSSESYNPEGVLLLKNQTFLIASLKMQTSKGERTLITGTPLNTTEILKVLGNQNSRFTFTPLNTNQLPFYGGVDSNFSENSPIWINNFNDNVQGISILRNKQGEAIIDTEVDEPHTILNNAYKTFSYSMGAFVISGSLLALVVLFYIDSMVLSRLKHLTERVKLIKQRDNPNGRLVVDGDDELSDLTTNINQMLESMENSRNNVSKSRLKYKNVFNNTGTAMTIHGSDGKFTMVNTEFENLSKYSKGEIESKMSWMNFFKGADLEMMKGYSNKRNHNNNPPRTYAARFIDRQGDVKDVMLTVTTIPTTEDILISYMDITKLNNTLKEKELLVREIHHRVKNNLQIISSLLNLQSRYVTDELSLQVLRESENRVKSISMVHEGLYRSKDLSNINFKNYIENLVTQLTISYGLDQNKIGIKMDIMNISLSIDTAVPVGLLITEILTNSIKYAFPEGEGNICLEFSRVNGYYILNIGDDGVGFASEQLDTNKSLGMQLIHSLSEQLDAELKIDTTNGTNYSFKFTEIRYKERI